MQKIFKEKRAVLIFFEDERLTNDFVNRLKNKSEETLKSIGNFFASKFGFKGDVKKTISKINILTEES